MNDSALAPALSFNGVSMVYPDGTHALSETSFDVRPGEFVTVVGPSGCGKSTLLKVASRAADAISLVGLSGFERKYPKQLSGGMKMRASLARSLVLDPKVFLFDEPFGAVDEITRERLNDEVISLFARQGFAGLFITHSISEAVFLSTRVLVMSARPGRIVADYPIPFEYPRLPDLRFHPEFARLAGQISHTLRGAHA